MTARLQVRDLTAGYDEMPVVRNLHLEVAAGEIVALLGPNGAGKTTTVRTIAGLLPRIGGDIDIDGTDVRAVAAHRIARMGVAYIPEDRALFSSLSVRENLRLCRGVDVDEVLDQFPPLAPLLDRSVGLLSGGEQQMLALARALSDQVKLLMVDEMSLGLAPVIVQSLVPVLRRAARERGIGVLLVEQHVHLALAVADRAYVLNQGRLVLSGDAQQLATEAELLASSYLGAVAIADDGPVPHAGDDRLRRVDTVRETS